jgi:hypothetical protein
MNFRAMMGPKTANGSEDMKTRVTIGPLCLLGTSSPSTIPKESWPAAATPLQALAAMSVSMECAVAPTMLPMILRTVVPITIHLRPKISESRPTSRKPTAEPRIQTVPTQPRLGDGPMSWLINTLGLESVLWNREIYKQKNVCLQCIRRQYPSQICAYASSANGNNCANELDTTKVAFRHFV